MGIWSYLAKDSSGWDGGEVTVVASADGILFEVEEEKAMDSYNQTFTCQCFVPWEKIDELITMLSAAKEGRPMTDPASLQKDR